MLLRRYFFLPVSTAPLLSCTSLMMSMIVFSDLFIDRPSTHKQMYVLPYFLRYSQYSHTFLCYLDVLGGSKPFFLLFGMEHSRPVVCSASMGFRRGGFLQISMLKNPLYPGILMNTKGVSNIFRHVVYV